MKHLIILIVLSGCITIKSYVGMTESEFISQNRNKVELIEQSSDRTVYRACGSDKCYFYYFRSGNMYRMDEGVREPDLIIQTKP